MKNHFVILFSIAILSGGGQSASGQNSSKAKSTREEQPITLEEMRSIARKYGVEKNITLIPLPKNQPLGASGRPVVHFTREKYEVMVKQMAYNEKKSAIYNQYYEDFQKLSTGREVVALMKAYVKRYPEYLGDDPVFSEEMIRFKERMADEIILNTPGYRKAHPQLK